MPNPILHIFLKNPIAGRVKTRLAEHIGEKAALEVYLALVKKTRECVLPLDIPKILWFDSFLPDSSESEIWGNSPLITKVQQGGDLGEKMRNAFLYSFHNGYSSAVLIGSDCAELQEFHIKEAFRILHEKEVVFGPAKDGGYYLIGLKKDFPELFHGIQWSTSTVLHASLEKVRQAGRNVGLLPVLSDIDTLKDLQECEAKGILAWRRTSS
ncbi:transferase 1, rSAM/selenodomain-associated [Leptospira inadai serovar Lyme str. 10]|uniref:Transferase 1, rSAM/selenodomain-associated n=2 Tax=Leptospira inadai serovar Lyme TaxID=293084 RepID=V6HDT2_9LEPT|nr:TIGR04282 family arsenosugar biosynthesis glycosyltransferase [Leptospira inadai]EQA37328.1 transferase 1, rSAM/selenodomain-associated [Leptospira inadai serovar Lyme str. 10]PNV75151.1 transferase [Leptospira inadai serovar Lyme]